MRPASRDEEIVRTLAERVRVMSLDQVARHWWTDTRWGKQRCQQVLQELAVEEMLVLRHVLARPVQRLASSLLRWHPGNAVPDFRSLSRLLHRRARQSARMTDIVFATARAVYLFGRRRPTIKLTQITHDLSVAEVYLHYRRQGQHQFWTGEDQLDSEWPLRIKPDAVLLNEVGAIVRAVEYGGDYPPERLLEIHAGMADIELSYEMW
jgi:hypothetical protein